jgi:hypothetical protein
MHLRDCSKNIIETLHRVNAKTEILQQMMKGVDNMQQLLCICVLRVLRLAPPAALESAEKHYRGYHFHYNWSCELGFSN